MGGMKSTFLLAWRYLSFHKVRTGLLVACIALVFFLPVAVQLLVSSYSRRLLARAEATPLVAGAPGSRYDLVLNALYFKGRVPNPTTMREVERVQSGGLATPIPVLCRHHAGHHPLVGTTPDYFAFRKLTPRKGTLPLLIGDAVLGAKAARELGLGPGDHLLSDPGNLFDLSLQYPLRLKIVGVLRASGTPDDGAVFCDIKTIWIIEGIGHGHVAPGKEKPAEVLKKKPGEVVFNAAVTEFNEVTPRNIASFHFHGDPETFPITAVIVVPRSRKAETLLKGRFRVQKNAQLLVPREVIDEIVGFVVKVKTFFDANLVLVTLATALFLALIVLLSLRVRQREMATLSLIGCAKRTVFRLQAAELGITLCAGLGVAALLALLLVRFVLESEVIL